ncbi:MAG: inositol monophosphatase [Candidatus Magasanikbacteria bacterium]|jgi:myo-inositol-1(or 4)-monophosphatase|nr:inositol monophosphatase [Candidatus Magasanikbacteria bacterium]MBT4314774.1 inositol monophosphatase [Candidatus Magasanikbacteria bacterium]MBT4547551.1 inositol monophosphatase [Candidatus Magasanikbacteria bacterium]MBT6819383.1 inositol monophosphatase [Candidatus Magasanikbacteria bacterium]
MLGFAKELAKEAGSLALSYYKEGISHRFKSSPDDLVTDADIAVSDFIIKKIKEKYPDHGIISEEEDEIVNEDAEYVWVIDPIDGTRNFAKHIAAWCTMIGLTKNGEAYIGVIYDAINDELFFAQKDKGAHCNGNKISVSNHETVKHAFTVFSNGIVDENSPYSPKKFQEFLVFYKNLMGENGHWISNHGTMLEACYLAAGRIDVLVKNSGLYHDYLAPSVIATEAGAVWTDCAGEKWEKGKMDIVVANPKLHKKLLELF